LTVLLYDNPVSGNCFKVRLLLTLLGIEFERHELSVVDHSGRVETLGGLSPTLSVPTVVLEDGRPLAQSNAILWYFADGTGYLPGDPYERGQVLQWMFFEQYSHEPYVATPRFIVRHLPADSPRRAELPKRLEQGHAALGVMESHLKAHRFFVAERYTIADIALYAYTHVAHEGHLDLAPYPSVRAWLERVAQQPRHIPITYRPG